MLATIYFDIDSPGHTCGFIYSPENWHFAISRDDLWLGMNRRVISVYFHTANRKVSCLHNKLYIYTYYKHNSKCDHVLFVIQIDNSYVIIYYNRPKYIVYCYLGVGTSYLNTAVAEIFISYTWWIYVCLLIPKKSWSDLSSHRNLTTRIGTSFFLKVCYNNIPGATFTHV